MSNHPTAAEIKALIASEQETYSGSYAGPPAPPRHDFLVPEEHLGALTKRLDGYIRRAGKLGVEQISYSIGSYIEEEHEKVVEITEEDLDGNLVVVETKKTPVVIRLHAVHIEGPAPKLAGWVFGGTLQALKDDQGKTVNVIRTVLEGVSAPAEFRTAETRCAHCNTLRQRKESFLVYSPETREWKQIGRNCIRDFLGHADAERYARFAESLADILSDCQDSERGSGGGGSYGAKKRFPLLVVLAQTAAIVESFGWKAKSKCHEGETSTAGWVGFNLSPPRKISREERKYLIDPTAVHIQAAQVALDWAKEISDEETDRSDYLSNIRTIARLAAIDASLFGYACSIPAAHARALQTKAERAEKAAQAADRAAEAQKSEWVGTVGERIVLQGVTVKRIIPIENSFNGVPTVTRLHIMKDAADNTLKWFASSGGGFSEGDVINLKATVKAHDTSKKDGSKETSLSRCAEHFEPVKKNKQTKSLAEALVAFGEALGKL